MTADKARQLYRLGHTADEIAAQLGMTPADVADALGITVDPDELTPEDLEDLDDLPPLLERDPDLSWQDDGLCREVDNDIFFPEKGGSTADAKAICRGCPVADPCLNYALRNDERFGIWGGKSERERRRLRRAS